MDFHNLSQLKVADLKQLLKQRNLSLVGNKSDLIQRLQTSLIKEATMINTGPAVANNSLSSTSSIKDMSKIEIDEDAILGDDDESSSMKNDDSIIQNEDLLLCETTNIVPTNPIVSVTNDSKIKANQQTSMSFTKMAPASKSDSAELAKNSEKQAILPIKSDTTSTKEQTNKTSIVSTKTNKLMPIKTTEEKKLDRQARFADPKLLSRAQRFGISIKGQPTSETGKLLKRMQRFGEAISTKAKSLEEQQRLERRMARFGKVTKSDSTTKPSSVSENILKRQARFGIVSKP
ncbi:SAP domain containing protein 1 [Sarcoptes scabiei]|uniref:SAP domain containing protein 1 n=1 Tax=Sarcoptes scabiei TaxID=52283 RepID=A0A132AAM7_SARSC|nr:SAP domain containing protein 1 [Sarcoptes scabiei]